jgi:transposase-like protein
MPRSRNIRLNLDPTAQLELKRLTQLPSIPAVVYRRARAILLLSGGMRYREVARLADLDRANIFRWTKRYMDRGVAGLKDLSRAKYGPRKSAAAAESNPAELVGQCSFAESVREINRRNAILAREGLLEQQHECIVEDEDCCAQHPGLPTHSTDPYVKAKDVPYSDYHQVV